MHVKRIENSGFLVLLVQERDGRASDRLLARIPETVIE
jgi:hypothetical protein